MSIAEIREVPGNSLVFVTGLPGAGKSTFCQQVVGDCLTIDRPIIFVTTEHAPDEILEFMAGRGIIRGPPSGLSFIDAFSDTVGLSELDRPDTVHANCQDLNSISMAIQNLQKKSGEDILLVFDSLTSPYLFNREGAFRFVSLCLSRFAAHGNSVLALIDEGCGQEEDVYAMTSLADGIIKMEVRDGSRTMTVVKHPKVRPKKINIPVEKEQVELRPTFVFEPEVMRHFLGAYNRGEGLRRTVGDFVNIFWADLAHWSCLLWDPKGFPKMIYSMNKEESSMLKESLPYYPLRSRISMKLLFAFGVPKSLSNPKDVRKFPKRWPPAKNDRIGILEYLEEDSSYDEHHIRIYESSDCWGLDKVGSTVASHLPPFFAGTCIGLESYKGLERDWNAIETRCIGLGDPYCEWKVVPCEIEGLDHNLEKDNELVGRICDRLMDQLMEYILDGKPLMERPTLGSGIHVHSVMHLMGFAHVAGERYRMAQRMGGAITGRNLGNRLIDAELSKDEAIKSLVDFMNHCKMGKVMAGDTFRIEDNCECLRTKIVATKIREPSCYFTTGFLNGFFSTVTGRHVRETKCLVSGNPYCEWEFM